MMEVIERVWNIEITMGQLIVVVVTVLILLGYASFRKEMKKKKSKEKWRDSHPDHW